MSTTSITKRWDGTKHLGLKVSCKFNLESFCHVFKAVGKRGKASVRHNFIMSDGFRIRQDDFDAVVMREILAAHEKLRKASL